MEVHRYPREHCIMGISGSSATLESSRSPFHPSKAILAPSQRAYAAFREAPARKHCPSFQGYHFNNDVPNRLTEQTRLTVYNWNPGPRRGKEGAIEKHTAGKWHIITLQQAIEYLEHDVLTNRFHVTHYGDCQVLFDQDTFVSDIKVSSNYLHDTRACEQDKIKEGESGEVLQGVVSRASFRRQPPGGQKFFTVMSLHINNNYAKKRGIGKKLLLTIRAIMQGTWTWSPVTSTELPGAKRMVTTSNPPVFLRKHLPTQIFQCRPAPHRCGAR